MSWSVSTQRPVDHAGSDAEIDALEPAHDYHAEQLEAAKKAAKTIARAYPKGGQVHVALSGHKDDAGAYVSVSVQHYAPGA